MSSGKFAIGRITIGALVTLLAAGNAYAQTADRAPVELQSAEQLTQDKVGKESWTYISPTANFPKYRTVIIEPVTVYDGPDSQFNGIDPGDRTRFAEIFTAALRSEISKSFPAPAKAKSDTLRVHVSLLGARKTAGGLATAARATPIGFGLHAAKSLIGKQGALTGSALIAVEVFDGVSGELLLSAIRRRSPDPLDIPATLSTSETIKAVARDFASSARRRLETMANVQRP